jgi:hypothetical protein
MFIHIGADQIIRAEDLIGIFDLALKEESKLIRKYLQEAERKKQIEVIDEESSKSFIVTRTKVYFSPISCGTLKKRAIVPYSDIKILNK